jgi:hypothetical protein
MASLASLESTSLVTRSRITSVSLTASLFPTLSLTKCTAEAALAYFNRTINHYDIATGEKKVTADLASEGTANATHTNSFVPLTSSLVQAFPIPIYPMTTMTTSSY